MAGIGCAYQADAVSLLTLYQFSGHAVIPSLATDMVDPTQFDTMINWAFVSLQLQHDLFENSLIVFFRWSQHSYTLSSDGRVILCLETLSVKRSVLP